METSDPPLPDLDKLIKDLRAGMGLWGWEAQAKQKLQEYILDIIGEDEEIVMQDSPKFDKSTWSNTYQYYDYDQRNQLRREQRNKLKDTNG